MEQFSLSVCQSDVFAIYLGQAADHEGIGSLTGHCKDSSDSLPVEHQPKSSKSFGFFWILFQTSTALKTSRFCRRHLRRAGRCFAQKDHQSNSCVHTRSTLEQPHATIRNGTMVAISCCLQANYHCKRVWEGQKDTAVLVVMMMVIMMMMVSSC